jgi:hypothetical protein
MGKPLSSRKLEDRVPKAKIMVMVKLKFSTDVRSDLEVGYCMRSILDSSFIIYTFPRGHRH